MGKFVTVLVYASSIQACTSFHFSQPVANLRQLQFPADNCCAKSPSSAPAAGGGGGMAPSARHRSSTSPRPLTECKAGSEGRDDGGGGGGGDGVDYSADPLTAFLGKFLPSSKEKSSSPQAEDLVFNVGDQEKRRGMSATEMASAVDEGLQRNGWFVTGRVDASLFSETFFFSDPQVSLTGVGKYAEGVAKLFDQEESRCDVISTVADGEDIVVRWRLSGRVNLPFKPPIKPYVVTTTFERDAEGLLSTQRDEFAIAGWDILLHAVFPGHPFGAAPAPPVERRTV
ncbi:unnamed protein product [Laminaria digitata]